jgi:hypothetical protein
MRARARRAPRRSWMVLSFGVSVVVAASCERDLEGAPCPCLDGYKCCPADNLCYASGSSCPDRGGASGMAGAAAGQSGGSGGVTSTSGGTSGTENGGSAGLGDGGDGAFGGNGGDGTVDPAEGQAKLPRFCNPVGWCGERNPLHAVWGFDGEGEPSDVWVVGRSEAEFGDNAFLHWDGRRWLNLPNLLGPFATVKAIWGSNPDDVWFVGGDIDGFAFAMHWDGQFWYEPWTLEIPELRAVAGLSQGDVWAVGAKGGMARWNGIEWSSVPSGVTVDLNAIGAVSAALYAVGASGTVLYWDGRETEPSPYPEVVTDVDLNAVWGRAIDDVWVAGDGATLFHYSDGGWSQVDVSHLVGSSVDFKAIAATATAPETIWLAASDGSLLFSEDGEWQRAPVQATHGLNGVWPAVNGEVWAVGDAGSSVYFDKNAWITSPEPVAADLFGVWAAATNDLWAVGSAGAVLRWNGSDWSRVSEPETAGEWAAVSGTSSRDVWIVGSSIIHFDGDTWAVARDEGPAMLRSVCAVGPDDVWAVGDGGVILHFDGDEWAPSDSFPEMNLKTVWCGATDDVWAIDAVDGVLNWDGESWLEKIVPGGPLTEVRSGQILAGSARDDVWVVSLYSNSDVGGLRTNLWRGVDFSTHEIEWSWGIPEAAHSTASGDFWLVGSAIWHAWSGIPSESYLGLGTTLHGVWAPSEPTTCDAELGIQPSGPNGAWAVGSSGTLLQKQCIRFTDTIIVDFVIDD